MLTDGDYLVRMVNLPGSVHGALRVDSENFGNIYIFGRFLIAEALKQLGKIESFKQAG